MRTSDKVIQQLQQFILDQQLEIGSKLPAERKLCELLGVSRSALRDAIRQLNLQGELSTRIGDGSYILQQPSPLSAPYQLVSPCLSQLIHQDPAYRFDVQETRLILESGIAWYAAERATTQDKQKIHYYYNQIAHYQSLGDNEQAANSDANFHLAIAEASHNIVLIQMMRELFDLLQLNIILGRRKVYDHPIRFDQLQQQHYDIMTAIDHADAAAAKHAVENHINFVIQQVRHIDDDEARLQRVHHLMEM